MQTITRSAKDLLLEIQSVWSVVNARFFRKGSVFGVQAIDPAAERLWISQIRATCERGQKLPDLHTMGYRGFSQFDEDGILQAILAAIGISQGTSVEIGIGDGRECNTTHLLMNHGWSGLLVDSNSHQVRRARRFFANAKDTKAYPPTVECRFVTPDDVNDLLHSQAAMIPEIDVFSLDIDSIDYWVLEAMEARPKVIVAEVRGWFPPELAMTVPTDWTFDKTNPEYYGQSLGAVERLLRRREYALVGANKYCSNAFFVREDVMNDSLPRPSVMDCSTRPRANALRESLWPSLSGLKWTDVR